MMAQRISIADDRPSGMHRSLCCTCVTLGCMFVAALFSDGSVYMTVTRYTNRRISDPVVKEIVYPFAALKSFSSQIRPTIPSRV